MQTLFAIIVTPIKMSTCYTNGMLSNGSILAIVPLLAVTLTNSLYHYWSLGLLDPNSSRIYGSPSYQTEYNSPSPYPISNEIL